MGHFPNLPSQQFKGKSRIGNYGDKMMEGDYHVGQILDTLKELGIDDNTIVVFASDNGPSGETARELGNQGTPDMGNSGPFRGELGEATEGAIRTAASSAGPGTSSRTPPHTPCSRSWTSCRPSPTSSAARCQRTGRLTAWTRPRCFSATAKWVIVSRCLTFIGADLVAVRWKQWRLYFTDVQLTGTDRRARRDVLRCFDGCASRRSITSRWTRTRIYVGGITFGLDFGLTAVEEYLASVKKYPNPPRPTSPIS